MIRAPFAAALAGLMLSGCIASTGYSVATLQTTTSLTREPGQAWAVLPPTAGRVLAVSERQEPRRLSQRIVLESATPLAGENVITVATASPDGSDPALLAPPTPAGIDAEMAAAIPGVRMARTNALGQNAYGAFGTALGHSAGVTCLFAWQHITEATSKPIDIRLRLCARATPEALTANMTGLRLALGPATDWTVRSGGLSVDPLAAASGLIGAPSAQQ
ncbi:cellulose biosynthesis protein BcsN [Oryzibacter oryziterrae]|uniref:cellulose biosynthesis protein BcsN n=1 Tax=Oryzibacter oryziterrae TaxID=2766474 RepID=UPI001F270916|nr:cellulose biosynthesis protein BcsN [Oryzibacter oryziterrae]